MEPVEKNTFYSPKEKILFYVAGCTDSFLEVNETIRMLQKGRWIFKNIYPHALDEKIKTDFIRQSSRYKKMRFFFVEEVEPQNVPAFAYKLREDWDMYKWLEQ